MPSVRACCVCGCTDNDCRGCIERTGRPCYWVEADLCSACLPPPLIDIRDHSTAQDRRARRVNLTVSFYYGPAAGHG